MHLHVQKIFHHFLEHHDSVTTFLYLIISHEKVGASEQECSSIKYFISTSRGLCQNIVFVEIDSTNINFKWYNFFQSLFTRRVFSQLFEIFHECLLGLEASIPVCHPQIPGSNLPLNPPKSELKNCPLNLITLYFFCMYISLVMI